MKSIAIALAAAFALAAAGMACAAPPAQDAAAPAMKTGKGVGVITEIDAKEATVTLKHEPIPALGWPSMTMPFRANPPSLLDGLKVGQKIAFDANEGHGLPEITAIRKR
ncbi:MAG TPA: copper-binding protein [Phenylobacterium sp.]|jgi:Cu(I)/Ag(I) efflux system protein CusF